MKAECEKCCGTCHYHTPDGIFPDDWTCANIDSDNFSDYTEYEDVCEFWEERHEEKRD